MTKPNPNIHPDLQGHGTYDYACRKRKCAYCKSFDLFPKPDIYQQPQIKPAPVIAPPIVTRRSWWRRHELDTLRNNHHLPMRKILRLLPCRSADSIRNKLWLLRNQGKINVTSLPKGYISPY